MTEMRELLNYAHWETKAADMYAREAVKHKAEYPSLAECYARMAERRLEDAEKLCQHVPQLMEHSNLKEEWIKKIIACNRSDRDCPKRMYYTLNPGGVSHAYFKRLFIDRVYKEGEVAEEYAFIQALVTDNEALLKASPDYMRQLQALPPKLRAAWLEGRWDIFAGQFFEEFVSEPSADGIRTHVIPAMHDIQLGWRIYRSYDWGYNKPFSCGWWAVDYDGRIYRILELYGCKKDEPNEGIHWTPDEQFKEIARIEREHHYLKGRKIQGVADPSIWDASKGVSVAETARRHGIHFEPGDNERIAGWMQCHYRLSFNEDGRPLMYVFDKYAEGKGHGRAGEAFAVFRASGDGAGAEIRA